MIFKIEKNQRKQTSEKTDIIMLPREMTSLWWQTCHLWCGRVNGWELGLHGLGNCSNVASKEETLKLSRSRSFLSLSCRPTLTQFTAPRAKPSGNIKIVSRFSFSSHWVNYLLWFYLISTHDKIFSRMNGMQGRLNFWRYLFWEK